MERTLELLRSWPVATAKSMSLTYGKPEVLCNSLMDIYLGKQSASLMKEFDNFCSLVMTVSETVGGGGALKKISTGMLMLFFLGLKPEKHWRPRQDFRPAYLKIVWILESWFKKTRLLEAWIDLLV